MPAIRAMGYLVLSLPLFVPGIGADHADDALAPDDLAVAADFLDRCSVLSWAPSLFESIRDPSLGQVVGRNLDQDLVPGEDPDEVLSHLARNVGQDAVLVGQLHPEHGVGQGLQHRALGFEDVLFRHAAAPSRPGRDRGVRPGSGSPRRLSVRATVSS